MEIEFGGVVIYLDDLQEFPFPYRWREPIRLSAESSMRNSFCELCISNIDTNNPKRNCMGYNCTRTLCDDCFAILGNQMFLCEDCMSNTVIQECAYCVDCTACTLYEEMIRGYVGHVITDNDNKTSNVFFRLYDGTSVSVDHLGQKKDRHFKVNTNCISNDAQKKKARWCIYEEFRRCDNNRDGKLGYVLSKKDEMGSNYNTLVRKEFELDCKSSMRGKYNTNAVFNVVVQRKTNGKRRRS